MKTRELLHCDIRTFGDRVRSMKRKELERHVARISSDLGEPDVSSLLESVVNAVFSDDGVPETSTEEMRRVLHALETHFLITEDNQDQVLRLVALCVSFVRQGVKVAAREQRLAARAGHHHNDAHHHHCEDPHCAEHGQSLGPSEEISENPLSSGIRSTLG